MTTNETLRQMAAMLNQAMDKRNSLEARAEQLEAEQRDLAQQIANQRELAGHLHHALRLLDPLGRGTEAGPEEETVEIGAKAPF